MTPPRHTTSRRRLLTAAGSLSAFAGAGCLGDDSSAENESEDADTDAKTTDDPDDQLGDDIDDEDFDTGHEDEPKHGQGGHDVDVSELLV
jgi:hypothetical protein